MNYQRLKLMRAAARVHRFHTQTTTRSQSVGEHTFGVIALLMEMQVAEERLLRLVRAALYHDASEAITGDIPSTAKWKHPILKETFDAVEKRIEHDFDIDIDLTGDESRLLKYCDLMELGLYSMEELETGNISMAVVVRNVLSAIKKRGIIDLTTSTLRLYELLQTKYESNYSPTLGSDVTHGWPDYE